MAFVVETRRKTGTTYLLTYLPWTSHHTEFIRITIRAVGFFPYSVTATKMMTKKATGTSDTDVSDVRNRRRGIMPLQMTILFHFSTD